MERRTLHPNLARVAAAYDWVMTRHQRGELSQTEALEQLSELVARDDQGVQWSLNPVSGNWQRKERSGRWVEDAPPAFGLRTPTPHDFRPAADGAFNPESRLHYAEVDLDKVYDPNSVVGSTQRSFVAGLSRAAKSRAGRVKIAVVALVVAGACLAFTFMQGGSDDEGTSPSPAPSPTAPAHAKH
jgi:hypothetical protein